MTKPHGYATAKVGAQSLKALLTALLLCGAADRATAAVARSLLQQDDAGGAARREALVARSNADLIKILHGAHGGDVVLLAPGQYRRPVLSGLHFAEPVAIRSQKPDDPAELVGMVIVDSNNIAFDHLDLTTKDADDKYYAFRVADSENLSFDKVLVHGDPSTPANDQLTGFYISNTSHVSISDSKFEYMHAGMISNNNSFVDIERNVFRHLSKSGIGMGACTDVKIIDNTFTDFDVGRGVHPDAIQFYTAGTHTSSVNLTITGNLIHRGKGNAIQGIFLGDEVGDLPYRNLTIADNALIGPMWDAIYVSTGADRLTVTDNIVASWRGLDMPGIPNEDEEAKMKTPPTYTDFQGFILLDGDPKTLTLTEKNNIAQVYKGLAERTGTPRGNRTIGTVTDGGAALLKVWAEKHPLQMAAFNSGN